MPFSLLEKLDLDNDGFTVLVLTGGVWPSSMVSPAKFADLRLPADLRSLQAEFEAFYLQNSIDSVGQADSSTDLQFVVSGCKELISLEGTYTPMIHEPFIAGYPVYRCDKNDRVLICRKDFWKITTFKNRTDDKCFAYRKISGNFPESLTNSAEGWLVTVVNEKWVRSAMKVSSMIYSPVTS